MDHLRFVGLLVLQLFSFLPHCLLQVLSNILANLVFLFCKKTIKLLKERGGLDSVCLKKIFYCYFLNLLEFLNLGRKEPSFFFSKLFGYESLKNLLNDKKGLLILSLHLGNPEVAGAYLSKLIFKRPYVIVLRHKNKFIRRFFIKKRQRYFNIIEIEEKKSWVKEAINRLKDKEALVYVCDEATDLDRGLEFAFYLYRKTNCNIIIAVSIRRGKRLIGYFFEVQDGCIKDKIKKLLTCLIEANKDQWISVMLRREDFYHGGLRFKR